MSCRSEIQRSDRGVCKAPLHSFSQLGYGERNVHPRVHGREERLNASLGCHTWQRKVPTLGVFPRQRLLGRQIQTSSFQGDGLWSSSPSFSVPDSLGQFLHSCEHTHTPPTPPHAHPIHELNQEWERASATHQRKVIRVNPDNAQVRIIGVVPSNLLQDFQELKTI